MTDGLIDQSEPLLSSEPSVALATLVAATGSTSKKVGTKMIVGESGRLIGGVTIGGCVDAQVVEAADELLEAGGRRVLSISLDDDEAWEIGLTCGGTVDVLIERVNVPTSPIRWCGAAARALRAEKRRHRDSARRRLRGDRSHRDRGSPRNARRRGPGRRGDGDRGRRHGRRIAHRADREWRRDAPILFRPAVAADNRRDRGGRTNRDVAHAHGA
jgi:xanthine/CO dehydrogenase XdhC/CoxF family maturation factor